MKFMQDIENQANLKALVLYDLKELGIKPPKLKKNKSKDEPPAGISVDAVFGNFLSLVPCCYVDECGPVPKFLVDATAVIEKHVDIEGLFRKSGSVARQKDLKQRILIGDDISDANPLDVASLIKQFFRELPEPLLTARLHDTFLKCQTLESHPAKLSAILLLCYLLPWQHLSTLRYFMRFLLKVSMNSDLNKMDVSNLSVCMTPNLLHVNSKNDKMNASESKLLQVQTCIVEMLIDNAEDIGMVSESLYERTNMMSACFPSDDELERSDTTTHDDSKSSKKKKRRSGSLQGLFTNLSNSFSKKRRPDYNKHNTSGMSNQSTMSYFDKTSMTSMMSVDQHDYSLPAHSVTLECMENVAADATPKMMRKRKAEEEVVPFSANKKKAILQVMPQGSMLPGTPFTPSQCRRTGKGTDFMDTPSIKFAEHDDMVFNATPMATPRRKMDKLFSPASNTKVKRSHSSGKSGCFSPKTPKTGVRRTVKGFFRRLSGGKDVQRMNQSDLGGEQHTATASIVRIQGEKKRSSFFRRHKKTPSSPARLVTQLKEDKERERQAQAMGINHSINSSLTSVQSQAFNESLSNTELAAQLQQDLRLISPAIGRSQSTRSGRHRRSLSGGANLKRGKPNTAKVGLKSKRRSVDTSINPEDPHGRKTPEKMVRSSSTLDTSPIPRDPSPLSLVSVVSMSGSEIGNPVDIEPMEFAKTSSELDITRQSSTSQIHNLTSQTSKSSLNSLGNDELDMCDHDRAFINESILAELEQEERRANAEKSILQDEFKIPDAPVKDNISVKSSSSLQQNHRVHTEERVVAKPPLPNHMTKDSAHPPSKGQSESFTASASIKLRAHHGSVESVDSAIESDITKSESVDSLASCDSGVGLNTSNRYSSSHGNRPKRLESFLKEGHRPVVVRKQQDTSLHEPNLQISTDMHHMLTKVGVAGEGAGTNSLQTVTGGTEPLEAEDPAVRPDMKEMKELSERHASPFRFTNSAMRRRRGASPVRIPTIFAKGEEAKKYREIIQDVSTPRGNSPIPVSRRPSIPISTPLARGVESHLEGYVGTPERQGRVGRAPVRGPVRASALSLPGPADAEPGSPKQPLRDSSNIEQSDVTATPKIKANLLAGLSGKRIVKAGVPKVSSPTGRRARRGSPIKPVKRLQSPKSPYHSRSPKRYITSPGKAGGPTMSPMLVDKDLF